jgi:hypothetical protein
VRYILLDICFSVQFIKVRKLVQEKRKIGVTDWSRRMGSSLEEKSSKSLESSSLSFSTNFEKDLKQSLIIADIGNAV